MIKLKDHHRITKITENAKAGVGKEPLDCTENIII